MIAISIDKVKAIQLKYEKEIKKQYNTALKNLQELQTTILKAEEQKYLNAVIHCFDKNRGILTDKPAKLLTYIKKIGVVPREFTGYNKKGEEVFEDCAIKGAILKALNYTYRRQTFYPKYFADFGVKCCVYCNAQLAITFEKDIGVTAAKFEVDHYLPKDKYPWLSISLFNLYPSCGPCNNAKLATEVSFDFYSNVAKKQKISAYKFGLEKGAKADYLNSRNIADIKLTFEEPAPKKNKKTFEDTFNIKKIYDTQLDIVEELILKNEMYDKTYRELLECNYKNLGVNKQTIDRFILGNYTSIQEIHKRPLSKFMQDIARDLGMIK